MDFIILSLDAFQVVFGEEHAGEAQFVGLGDALLDARHGTDFAVQSHLTGEAGLGVDGQVGGGGEDGGHDGEVDGGIVNMDAAGDVDEHILRPEFEVAPFLQDGQQHVEPADVVAGGGTLRGAIHRAAHQRLYLDGHGTGAG